MSLLQSASIPVNRGLRARVAERALVVGTFVKSTAPQTIELLGRSGLDFVVLDAEHAPFDIGTLDAAIGAAHALSLPALVRPPSHAGSFVNSCLDMGASGVVMPHIRSTAEADAVADAVRYGRGKRGFSPSGRAGNYGQVDAAAYRAAADQGTSIWCQIEDADALERIDEIAANDAADCLFIGPADLGLSLGCDGPGDLRLAEAIRAIAEAGSRHGRAVGLFVSDTGAIPAMREIGITVFVCGSDQSFLLGRAQQVAAEVSALIYT